jgi:hypothetical protein
LNERLSTLSSAATKRGIGDESVGHNHHRVVRGERETIRHRLTGATHNALSL